MRKRFVVLTILTLLMVAACLGGLLEAADWPDGLIVEITINDQVYEGHHQKGPVTFPHRKHYVENGVACEDCHHAYKNGANIWKRTDPVEKCSSCHPYEQNQDKLLRMKMGTVFHNKCRSCHKEVDKGPTQCTGCHAPLQK